MAGQKTVAGGGGSLCIPYKRTLIPLIRLDSLAPSCEVAIHWIIFIKIVAHRVQIVSACRRELVCCCNAHI